MPCGLQEAVLYYVQRHLRAVYRGNLQRVSELWPRPRFWHTDLYGLQWKHIDTVLLRDVAETRRFSERIPIHGDQRVTVF